MKWRLANGSAIVFTKSARHEAALRSLRHGNNPNMANRPKRPFACYECGETKRLKVASGTNERRRANRDGVMKKRRVASVECRNCGNEWWSAHPTAVALADKRDKSRERFHKNSRKKVA